MGLRTLLLAVAIVLSACGGSSLTASDYFGEVEAARAEYETELDELDETFINAISAIDYQAAEAEQQLAILFRDQVNANSTAFRLFTDRLKTLQPPSELTASHEDAVVAAEAVVTVFRDRQDELNAIANLFDVDTFASDPEIAETRSRFVEACNELQALADNGDIPVDLSCGS